MPPATGAAVTKPHVFPFYRAVPRLVKDPVTELARMGVEAGGEVVRLDIGPFRPYLISHPDHVQQVLKTDWSNFVREGMFWRPLGRLLGHSVFSEGDAWESSRKILKPLFTARYITQLGEALADTIADSMGDLDEHARTGRPIDGGHLMTTITNQAVVKVLFGGHISRETAERLAPEFATCATSIHFRMLLPFAPYSIRVPGDRPFLASVQKIDDVVRPVIERAARDGDTGATEVVSALLRARVAEDGEPDIRQIRDDLVNVYGAASETTAMSLTWLWTVLHEHPEVDDRLHEEIDTVVGAGPVRASHVAELSYLRMVLEEVLRLHPPSWIIPRQVVADTEIGGVTIKAGSQVLVSPYTTHRLAEFWDRPLEFDPERWSPDHHQRRHPFAFIPFGGGPHVCLGRRLYYLEAPLVIATILSRYRQELTNPQRFTPLPGASMRPKEKIMVRLVPKRPLRGDA